jgi:hypothetical protein
MDDRVEQLLIEFASHRPGVSVAETPARGLVLLVDDRCVVIVIDDTHADVLRACAHIGDVAPAHVSRGTAHEWASCTREVDGFGWSVACHVESGAMAITSDVPRSIDAIAFDAWLQRYVERVRASAGAFATHLHG